MLMESERHAPDHAAVVLAAHQPRVDDPPGCEGADEARDPGLAEIGVDLDLCEDCAMRMHSISFPCDLVGCTLAAAFDFGEPGAGENVDIALAAAFVIAAEKPSVAREHAGIAATEQGRAFIARRHLGEPGDGVTAGSMDGRAGRCGMGRPAGDPRVPEVRRAGPELDLIDSEPEAIRCELGECGPGALTHVRRAGLDKAGPVTAQHRPRL